MSETIYNVLFLCTGNSARSIMAEALLNHRGHGRFRAFSAGSHPTGTVHPFAHETLGQVGINPSAARSKSWQEFTGPAAAALDFVITLCDRTASEACPQWPGQPITAHWGIFDPVAIDGPDAIRREAFGKAFQLLERRISLFTVINPASLERWVLQERVRRIGDERAS